MHFRNLSPRNPDLVFRTALFFQSKTLTFTHKVRSQNRYPSISFAHMASVYQNVLPSVLRKISTPFLVVAQPASDYTSFLQTASSFCRQKIPAAHSLRSTSRPAPVTFFLFRDAAFSSALFLHTDSPPCDLLLCAQYAPCRPYSALPPALLSAAVGTLLYTTA